MPLHIVQKDITTMNVDAIVNAAKTSLLGGGGVDGAIHRAAGPQLLEECRTLGGCETGDAKRTKAYWLPSRYVIHTPGPIWRGGGHGEEALLRSCYRRSLEEARDADCRSVAFPLISSGIYGYPKEEALRVAREAITQFLDETDEDMDVYIAILNRSEYRIEDRLYEELLHYLRTQLSPDDIDLWNVPELSVPMPAMLGSPAADVEFARPQPASGAPFRKLDLQNMLDEQEEGFSRRLLRLIDESGMKDAECYRKANVDRKLFSKIRSNPDYRPKKSTAVAFALALQLPLEETRKLLESAGYALTRSSKSDIIVEYCIERGVFDVRRVNEALFAFEQPTLG